MHDTKEDEIVASVFGKRTPPCCSIECNKIISEAMVIDFRSTMQNLDKEQQDLIILAHLAAHRDDITLRSLVGDRSRSNTKRCNAQYYFRGFMICHPMYFFLHNLTIKRYKALISHFDKNSVLPREHGMMNKVNNRTKAISEEETKQIVLFIRRFAESVAITLPGRLPNHKNFSLLKLPSTENKSTVYRRYIENLPPGNRFIRLRTFQHLWKIFCPYIVTMKPAYDLCELCHTLSKAAAQTVNVSEEVKKEALRKYTDHLQLASDQRLYYNDYRTSVQTNLSTYYPGISESEHLVISMDFAQNVSFPSGPQQVGTAYFKSARKAAIFGITNERQNIQHTFCIDESDLIGKGPNTVLSMLDYYLCNIHPKNNLIIFADNCVSQNKNNTVIRYLQYLVDTGKCLYVELNFLLSGHTKFSPDRLFGVFKAKYAKSNVDCFSDVIECVAKSSPNGYNVPVAVRNPNSNVPTVPWKDFDHYFASAYNSLSGISKFHHFNFSAGAAIKCRHYAASEVHHIDIHRNSEISFANQPPIIPTPGLTKKRQWYLFKNVRVLCIDKTKRDLVAPHPGESESEDDSEAVDNVDTVESSTSGQQHQKKVDNKKTKPVKTVENKKEKPDKQERRPKNNKPEKKVESQKRTKAEKSVKIQKTSTPKKRSKMGKPVENEDSEQENQPKCKIIRIK